MCARVRPGSLCMLRCSLFDCLLPWTAAPYTRVSVVNCERELLALKHIFDCVGCRLQRKSCSIPTECYLCFKTHTKKAAVPFLWGIVNRNCHLEKLGKMFPLCDITEKKKCATDSINYLCQSMIEWIVNVWQWETAFRYNQHEFNRGLGRLSRCDADS